MRREQAGMPAVQVVGSLPLRWEWAGLGGRGNAGGPRPYGLPMGITPTANSRPMITITEPRIT